MSGLTLLSVHGYPQNTLCIINRFLFEGNDAELVGIRRYYSSASESIKLNLRELLTIGSTWIGLSRWGRNKMADICRQLFYIQLRERNRCALPQITLEGIPMGSLDDDLVLIHTQIDSISNHDPRCGFRDRVNSAPMISLRDWMTANWLVALRLLHMNTPSASLALCEGNPHKVPLMRGFAVFFSIGLKSCSINNRVFWWLKVLWCSPDGTLMGLV